MWTFVLPGLRERPEDIAPNLAYELERAGTAVNKHITMSREARDRFLEFAHAPGAAWSGNFRDFNAAVRRMATLCQGGRIGVRDVDEEIARLRAAWALPADVAGAPGRAGLSEILLGSAKAAALDRFDRVQLDDALRVCQQARNLSDAGRALFAASRAAKDNPNDADRLRKYLARFGLSFQAVRDAAYQPG